MPKSVGKEPKAKEDKIKINVILYNFIGSSYVHFIIALAKKLSMVLILAIKRERLTTETTENAERKFENNIQRKITLDK
jgi:hypothetical protein